VGIDGLEIACSPYDAAAILDSLGLLEADPALLIEGNRLEYAITFFWDLRKQNEETKSLNFY
jgi:hypothetical protein